MYYNKKILVNALLAAFAIFALVYVFVDFSPNKDPKNIAIAATTTDPFSDILYNNCKETRILFIQDQKDTINDTNIYCLDFFANYYSRNIYSTITLNCRSSSDGSSENRKILSDKRCFLIQQKLLNLGVSSKDIIINSLSDSFPIENIDPMSPQGLINNRSVTVVGNN